MEDTKLDIKVVGLHIKKKHMTGDDLYVKFTDEEGLNLKDIPSNYQKDSNGRVYFKIINVNVSSNITDGNIYLEGNGNISFPNRSLNPKFNGKTVIECKDGNQSIISGGFVVIDNGYCHSILVRNDNGEIVYVNDIDLFVETSLKLVPVESTTLTKSNSLRRSKSINPTDMFAGAMIVVGFIIIGIRAAIELKRK